MFELHHSFVEDGPQHGGGHDGRRDVTASPLHWVTGACSARRPSAPAEDYRSAGEGQRSFGFGLGHFHFGFEFDVMPNHALQRL